MDERFGRKAVDAGRSQLARRRWGDRIWAAAPIVSGVTGVAGFAMLAAEVFHWCVTGHWSATPIRKMLEPFGQVGESFGASLNILGAIPLSLVLIAIAPCFFLVMIKIGERLEVTPLPARDSTASSCGRAKRVEEEPPKQRDAQCYEEIDAGDERGHLLGKPAARPSAVDHEKEERGDRP